MHKVFRYLEIFETLKGFPRNLSALLGREILKEKRDTHYDT